MLLVTFAAHAENWGVIDWHKTGPSGCAALRLTDSNGGHHYWGLSFNEGNVLWAVATWNGLMASAARGEEVWIVGYADLDSVGQGNADPQPATVTCAIAPAPQPLKAIWGYYNYLAPSTGQFPYTP